MKKSQQQYNPPNWDDIIAKFKSGEMDISKWNCCIHPDGEEYGAYIMGSGAEDLLVRKMGFPSEQSVRDFYREELGVTQGILWL